MKSTIENVVGIRREREGPPAHTRASGGGNHDSDFRRVPPNSDEFREALLQRANAPFQIARQPRAWGLNECREILETLR
jgi:hypothetical protein